MAFADDTNPRYIARRNAKIAEIITMLKEDVQELMPLSTGWPAAAQATFSDPVMVIIVYRLHAINDRLKALEAFVYKR